MWSKGSRFPKAMALPKPSECPLIAQHRSALGTWPRELRVVEVVQSSQGSGKVPPLPYLWAHHLQL